MTEGVKALPTLPVMPPRERTSGRTAGSAPGSTSLRWWGLRRGCLFCCLDVAGRGARWWRSLPAYSGLLAGRVVAIEFVNELLVPALVVSREANIPTFSAAETVRTGGVAVGCARADSALGGSDDDVGEEVLLWQAISGGAAATPIIAYTHLLACCAFWNIGVRDIGNLRTNRLV